MHNNLGSYPTHYRRTAMPQYRRTPMDFTLELTANTLDIPPKDLELWASSILERVVQLGWKGGTISFNKGQTKDPTITLVVSSEAFTMVGALEDLNALWPQFQKFLPPGWSTVHAEVRHATYETKAKVA